MYEGEIIKFYRKKAGLSQEQLGEGICTATHVSKIERGQTKYSKEIIALFSERLKINIEQEIKFLQNVFQKLQYWHNAIILQKFTEVEKVKDELEQFPSIHSSKYARLYQLLLARYHLLKGDSKKAFRIVKTIQQQKEWLTAYETNLLQHIIGICYITRYSIFECEDKMKAVEALEVINMEDYGNEEYYYHLAAAYHYVALQTKAYIYAEKALRYFRNTNNYSRAILAESIMLLQSRSATDVELTEKVERYHNLINDSDTLGQPHVKAMLLHNLGYEYFKQKQHQNAHHYLRQALLMANNQSSIFVNRLFNYLDNSVEGATLPYSKILSKIQEGMNFARKIKNPLYDHLFTLLICKLENNKESYYQYIEHTALPFFHSYHHFSMIEKYGKELYAYYVRQKEYKKAVQLVGEMNR